MVRIGMRVGPFYVSSSSRRRRRGPTAAQRRAQAAAAAQRRAQQRVAAAQHRAEVDRKRAQRRAMYGRYRLADPRTWFSSHWLLAILGLALVVSLPALIGDGPTAQAVWSVAVAVGVVVWGIWIAMRHAEQAPARRAVVEQARLARQRAEADVARSRQQAAAYAAAQTASRTAWLAPRQVGNAWKHAGCPVNHRTWDAASRCRKR